MIKTTIVIFNQTIKVVYLIFLLPVCALGQSADTIIIKNFNTSNYKASFNHTGIQAINGNYYFANENGILQYDGSDWQLHSIKDYSGVFSLAETEDEVLYVGGLNEFGYARRDSSGIFQYTSLRDKISPDSVINQVWQTILHNDDVYYVSYERILRWDNNKMHHLPIKDAYIFPLKEELYASAFNGNLVKIQGDSTVFVSNKIKLKNDAAFALLPHVDGKYVIFTSLNGLFLLDPTKGSVEKWNANAAPFFKKNYLYACVLWKDSLYACTTGEHGLAFMDKQGVLVKNLTKSDGFSTDQLREPFLDQRDNIWLASTNGISYVQWPVLNQSDVPPQTVITKITNGERKLARPYVTNGMEMNYKNPVTFYFATPNYDKSDLEYSFYLDGTDKNWSEWTDDIKKEYTNINSGTHTFYVKGRLLNGWETTPATLTIYVPKPWYLTYWFIGSMGFVGFGLIYLIFKVRTLQLKRLNRHLEYVVNNRTSELIRQREQLQNANKDLRTMNTELDNFVYRSSHDLVAPLKSLKGLIHLAKLDNPGSTQMHYLQIMNSSVLKLEDFIKSIMDYSVNAKRDIEFKDVVFDDIISDVSAELKYFEKADRVELHRLYDPNFKLKSDSSRLKIILSNLITNSVKYHNYDQPQPHIKVSAVTEKDGTRITVEDNGLGIPEEFHDKIFDMFFRASESADGSGLGLYIVKDTAAKIGAEIKLTSKPGIGTTFTLWIKNKSDKPHLLISNL